MARGKQATMARSGQRAITKPAPALVLEIMKFDGGGFFAAPAKGSDVFFGITHSPKSIPDLLRNTATALETIHEMNPDQFPQMFAAPQPKETKT